MRLRLKLEGNFTNTQYELGAPQKPRGLETLKSIKQSLISLHTSFEALSPYLCCEQRESRDSPSILAQKINSSVQQNTQIISQEQQRWRHKERGKWKQCRDVERVMQAAAQGNGKGMGHWVRAVEMCCGTVQGDDWGVRGWSQMPNVNGWGERGRCWRQPAHILQIKTHT